MLALFRDTFACLLPAERRGAIGVFALMTLMAFFEVVGIAGILPFLAVLADPRLIDSQPALAWAYATGGFQSVERFLLFLGLGAFLLLLLAAAVRSIAMFVQYRFVHLRRHTLGCRLLAGYLNQPYEFFLNRHTGDLGKNILSEVDIFVDRVLTPMGTMIAHAMVFCAIVAFLLFIDPVTAFIAAFTLGAFYLITYSIIRSILTRTGDARVFANRTRFQTATEALGGIKTLKMLGREDAYHKRFATGSETFATGLAQVALLGQLPKYLVETIAFGGIILGAMIALSRNGLDEGLGTLLPMLSLYALAGYRMLPALQAIYSGSTTLRFATPAVSTILEELATAARAPKSHGPCPRLPFEDRLELRDVVYRYPDSQAGLNGVSLSLAKGESLGVIGRTGAGKTTFIDVILGLLVPQSGELLVDGIPLTESRRRQWRKAIGYVPQDIFLTDASLAENIALGLHPDEIDNAKIEKAAQIARIHDFVIAELPNGYATQVGERGVRLSGGQRQRVGIARALYHDPDVLVFDEATSALDRATESEVMAAIEALFSVKTMIMIAHRTETVADCDRVITLERGVLAGEGQRQNAVTHV